MTCAHTYTAGTQVTLTATGSAGSAFAGWSGGGCSGTGPCRIGMNADVTVGASFVAALFTAPAQATSSTTASFSGSVNPDGLPTTAFFEYGLDPKYTGGGPVDYTNSTPVQSVGSDFTSHTLTASVSGLVPNALYHVRVVATNSQGTAYGQDVTFTTPKSPPAPPPAVAVATSAPPPALGQSFNLSPVSGVVLVEADGRLVPLTELSQIPKNTVIDALHGTLSLTAAAGRGAPAPAHDASGGRRKHKPKVKTQKGTFGGAVFEISQATKGAGRGLVTLTLVEGAAFKGAPSYATCKKHTAADVNATIASSKTLQRLHASAHGNFRTKGRYAAAIVRSTKWTIADRCDGTLTHDITGSVSVTDLVRHKTIILHAGQTYLAQPKEVRRRSTDYGQALLTFGG